MGRDWGRRMKTKEMFERLGYKEEEKSFGPDLITWGGSRATDFNYIQFHKDGTECYLEPNDSPPWRIEDEICLTSNLVEAIHQQMQELKKDVTKSHTNQ
jgi:hypothetical protein